MASKINADEFVDREGEGKPTLPKGVVLSGVTTITTAVVAENEVANSTGINVGIITSTHFAGNLTGDVNAGIVTVSSQTVIGSAVTISASGIDIGAGVITATSYAGSGANLTGVGATIMIWEYNPEIDGTTAPLDTGIGITFNQKIKAGSGNITIRSGGYDGTVVENFGIGNSVTISGNSLSFTPTSSLSQVIPYYVTLPSGVITNMAGEDYVGTAFSFTSTWSKYNLWVTGKGEYGALGQNSVGKVSSPVQIPGDWSKLYEVHWGGGGDMCAAKDPGTLWMWGRNDQAPLGQNNVVSYSSPVQVPGTTWAHCSTGGYSGGTLATKTDGTLWTWGANGYGTLGDSNRENYSSPIQIPGTTWSTDDGKIKRVQYSAWAIKTDGTLWSWGNNDQGQLGQNEGEGDDYSSPVQIPGTTWSKIASSNSTIAIKTDGTMWSWGLNQSGSLGLNNTVMRYSSPTQVPGTTWDKVICGGDFTVAHKTDGTLWAWGEGNHGRLGQNNLTNRSSPVQIPGTTWTTKFAMASSAQVSAIKTDGSLWQWGYNGEGVLGLNAPENSSYSSPVQFGSDTDWISVMGNSNSTMFTLKTQ